MKTRLLKRLKDEAEDEYILCPLKNENKFEIRYWSNFWMSYESFENTMFEYDYGKFETAVKDLKRLRQHKFWELACAALYERRRRKLEKY